jgi:hypothetical protein
MSKYLITLLQSDLPGRTMILEYDDTDEGFLKSWTVDGEWPVPVWREFWKRPPINESTILSETAFLTCVRIENIENDLSFARFWEEYGYKIGPKSKIEKQFNAIAEAEKIKIFKAIPRYHRYLTVSGVNQAMASTWLAQERWNNDYSTKAQNKR